MRLYPSDASAPRSPTRGPRRFHAGVEFGTPGNSHHTYLLAACNSQQLLDGDSGIEEADLADGSKCQRRSCRWIWEG